MTWGDDISPAMRQAMIARGLDGVAGAMAFDGGADLVKANLGHRRRTRLEVDVDGRAQVLFLKRYGREKLLPRLRRLLTQGHVRGPAEIEFENIRAVARAGVRTMRGIVMGQTPGMLGPRQGYVVVSCVGGQSLEKLAPELAGDEQAARRLTEALIDLVGRFHAAGLVHRDLYACHIFVDRLDDGSLALSLIDLARVFRPRWRAFRWCVKDLAQLKYSMPPAWTSRWWDAFLRGYLGDRAGEAARWDRAIGRKVAAIARHTGRKIQRAGKEGAA